METTKVVKFCNCRSLKIVNIDVDVTLIRLVLFTLGDFKGFQEGGGKNRASGF